MKALKYLFLGFLSAGAVHLMMNASCLDSSTGPNDNKVDVGKIHESAKRAEEAFAAADTGKLAMELTETSLRLYRSQFAELQPAMEQFAEAFKGRKLSAYNELFAEYEFFVDGQRYTVSFTRADDGSWKIIRF